MDPRKFTDTNGDDWLIRLDVATNKRVRDELGVDLLKFDDTLYGRLLTEPEILVDVLYVVLAPRIADRNLDAVGFAERLAGDVIEDAAVALLEAITDFFPRRRREVLKRALHKSQDFLARSIDHSEALLESPTMAQALEDLLETQTAEMQAALARGRSSTNGPASSPSTPAPSPSASSPA